MRDSVYQTGEYLHGGRAGVVSGVLRRGGSDSCDRQVPIKCDEQLGERWIEIARVWFERDGNRERERERERETEGER